MMVKNVIIAALATFIAWHDFFVEHPHPWFLIPCLFFVILAILVEAEELIRKEWFY